MITRVLRLLFSGALFSAGYALGRLLLMPFLRATLADRAFHHLPHRHRPPARPQGVDVTNATRHR